MTLVGKKWTGQDNKEYEARVDYGEQPIFINLSDNEKSILAIQNSIHYIISSKT